MNGEERGGEGGEGGDSARTSAGQPLLAENGSADAGEGMWAAPKQSALRVVLVLLTAATAYVAGENFSYIGAVVGSVGATTLSFILPCVFHSVLFEDEVTRTQTALNVGTSVIGFVCGAVGLYTTIRSWGR